MSYTGKLKLKLKAQVLRRQGFSVREIQSRLGVSRSSVSLWVRDVHLTEKQLRELYLNKRTGNLRGSIIAAQSKKRLREEVTRKLFLEGIREMGRISKRERFLIGVALYFAEGTKGDDNVSFSNTDSRSLTFMMEWLREFCQVPEKKFRCSLYLHENLDENKAKQFWSRITRIPLAQFRKTYIVENRTKRFRKTKHEQGVCRVTVSDVSLHRKIMGWIAGLFENNYSPVAQW